MRSENSVPGENYATNKCEFISVLITGHEATRQELVQVLLMVNPWVGGTISSRDSNFDLTR